MAHQAVVQDAVGVVVEVSEPLLDKVHLDLM